MVITPLIDRLGGMWDYMASARHAGVRTVFPVHSWDNLSSKARIIHVPDRVLVWNETQVEEAKKFHGIPSKRIQVTGAQGFDDWFAMAPSTSREEFCDALSFNPDRPILLYVCSAILKRHMAPSIASEKTELAFFTRWISALRSSGDDRLRDANVIIRPHPKREAQWDDVDLSGWGAVKVFPRHGRLPNDRSSKAIFFELNFSLCRSRWHQHERDDRGRHHRKAGDDHTRSRLRRRPSRNAAFPISVKGRRWTSDHRQDLRRTFAAAQRRPE